MTRRRFAFWLSFGLFALAEKLRVYGLDELAAATLRGSQSTSGTAPLPVHWRAADNGVWRWFERETMIDGQWVLSGITTPMNVMTGEPYTGRIGYLDERVVPEEIRRSSRTNNLGATAEELAEFAEHRPSPARRSRHGRPPSKWLRSLRADELRIWLKTIDVPEAGVSGMTFWEHLTRDHSFNPENIEGLSIPEQAKLHAAAHFGY